MAPARFLLACSPSFLLCSHSGSVAPSLPLETRFLVLGFLQFYPSHPVNLHPPQPRLNKSPSSINHLRSSDFRSYSSHPNCTLRFSTFARFNTSS
ncbi:hypothetical protein DER45DRAFT_246008 [Fusarium avenaceum]|nr:hypothetical protein DER45DRAFT_246008 [Fusarium avenaceum]